MSIKTTYIVTSKNGMTPFATTDTKAEAQRESRKAHQLGLDGEIVARYWADVWFGGLNGVKTNHRQYCYSTRKAAQAADISDNIGTNGRVA